MPTSATHSRPSCSDTRSRRRRTRVRAQGGHCLPMFRGSRHYCCEEHAARSSWADLWHNGPSAAAQLLGHLSFHVPHIPLLAVQTCWPASSPTCATCPQWSCTQPCALPPAAAWPAAAAQEWLLAGIRQQLQPPRLLLAPPRQPAAAGRWAAPPHCCSWWTLRRCVRRQQPPAGVMPTSPARWRSWRVCLVRSRRSWRRCSCR